MSPPAGDLAELVQEVQVATTTSWRRLVTSLAETPAHSRFVVLA
jgi:hypothetical protein